MSNAARWMRLGRTWSGELQAACAGLAQTQQPGAGPIVLWAQAGAPVIAEPAPVEETHYSFAMVVPLRLAPGRRSRWRAWGLAPALATYRRFGAPAYLDDDAVCLNGRRIGQSGARAIGGCAVIAGSFLPRLPAPLAGWTERDLEAVFRERIEAQHGWQFDNAWPSALEQAAIAEALALEGAGAA